MKHKLIKSYISPQILNDIYSDIHFKCLCPHTYIYIFTDAHTYVHMMQMIKSDKLQSGF